MKKEAIYLRKVMVLALAGVLAGSVLMGCGNIDESKSEDSSSKSQAASEGEAPSDAPVELVWYVAGKGPQADTDSVLAEVNAYLKEKLNCTLKLVETDFGSYDQKIQMLIASQEKFDLCFTANWCNSYYNNVNKNAFIELDDLIEKNAPDLKTLIPQKGWDAVKVKGNIYAVPNMQIWTMTNCLTADKEYIDQYNYDISAVKEMKDLEPLMEAVKRDHPDMYPLAIDILGGLDFLTFHMGYDELVGRHIPGAVMLEDEELKVVNQFELPKVTEYYKLMYDWNQKGYIRKDAFTISDSRPDVKAGRHVIRFSGNVKPGLEIVEREIFGGRDAVIIPMSDSWLTTTGITATMTAISRTSEHQEKAVEFLNLLNKDQYLYNLITQGIEGKHYEKLDEKYIVPIKHSGYAPGSDWMYGNQFLAYLKEGQQPDDWEKTMEMNSSGRTSAAFGFVFDPSNVQSEIASVNAVVKEFELSLDTGSVDPEIALPQFLEKLKQAGSQTIIDEAQRQLDEWKASK